MNDLVKRLNARVVWWQSSNRNNREYDVTDCDLDEEAADHIEAQNKLIEGMREALERIAFDGIADRDKLMRSALDYIATGGKYPNERTIAAIALSKSNPNTPERND